jgi:GMP synthase-like glutamine amidotransferase
MRVHYLQHVPFEDAANIGVWARDRGHRVTGTQLCEAEPLPPLDSFDWLVIMGGLMNIHEHDAYPWLVPEKEFIREAIDEGRSVLGICLGAQLVAHVLGGQVKRNRHREIGWFPVVLTEKGRQSPLFEGFPQRFNAFHWHGDTFSIPPGAEKLAESEACANQAFQYAGHVVGLQFHLDYAVESIEKMLRHCAHELSDGAYVQASETIRAAYHQVPATSSLLYRLLHNLEVRQNAG